jgi:hypothetical protein
MLAEDLQRILVTLAGERDQRIDLRGPPCARGRISG